MGGSLTASPLPLHPTSRFAYVGSTGVRPRCSAALIRRCRREGQSLPYPERRIVTPPDHRETENRRVSMKPKLFAAQMLNLESGGEYLWRNSFFLCGDSDLLRAQEICPGHHLSAHLRGLPRQEEETGSAGVQQLLLSPQRPHDAIRGVAILAKQQVSNLVGEGMAQNHGA